MGTNPPPSPPIRGSQAALLVVLGVLAAAVRLHDLAAAPLAVDEFYFGQSIRYILEHGVPRFPFGGFYSRAPLLQYPTALLVALVSPYELALRLLPALAGAVTVPLVFLVARRHLPGALALGCAVVLALSSWHIELSRFGRMYSTFGLLFLAFVLFLEQGWWDGRARARRAAWITACLAALVHETSIVFPVILAVLPLGIPGRPRARWAIQLRRAAYLLAFVYVANRLPLRDLGTSVRLPDGVMPPAAPNALVMPRLDLLGQVVVLPWLLLVPLVLGGLGIRALRRAPPADIWSGLLAAAVIVCCAAHQVTAAGLVIVVGAFLSSGFRGIVRGDPRPWAALLLATAYLWGAAGLAMRTTWLPDDTPVARLLIELAKQLFYFPEIIPRVALPALRAMPITAALLGLGVALGMVRLVFGSAPQREHGVLVVVLLSMATISSFATYYTSTRYSAFLLPLLWVLVVLELRALGARLVRAGRTRTRLVGVLSVTPFLVFAAGDDFHPGHVLDPGSPYYRYRLGRLERFQDHWYPRADFRSPAEWINARWREGDEVLIDVVPVAEYLEVPFHAYCSPEYSREFPNVSVEHGTRERWTGRPLLYRGEQVVELVPPAGSRLWVVTAQQGLQGHSLKGYDRPLALARRHGFDAELVAAGRDGRVAVWRLARREPVRMTSADRGDPGEGATAPGDPGDGITAPGDPGDADREGDADEPTTGGGSAGSAAGEGRVAGPGVDGGTTWGTTGSGEDEAPRRGAPRGPDAAPRGGAADRGGAAAPPSSAVAEDEVASDVAGQGDQPVARPVP